MFYLIFYLLCPRGCTIIHTEGKSVLTLRMQAGNAAKWNWLA